MEFCSSKLDRKSRNRDFQERRMVFLKLFRDSLERRIASVEASIATLEKQIERDNNTVSLSQ